MFVHIMNVNEMIFVHIFICLYVISKAASFFCFAFVHELFSVIVLTKSHWQTSDSKAHG